MRTSTYDITEEPVGAGYDGLLEFCARLASTCSLVVRTEDAARPGVRAFLETCHPYLLEENKTSEWPGTILSRGASATLYRYAVPAGMLGILRRHSRGLYAWLAPSLPEDLAMYRPGGSVLLGSIAHERDSWLTLAPDERALIAVLPLRLSEHPGAQD